MSKKNNPFERYLFKKQNQTKKQIELDLSDSEIQQPEPKPQQPQSTVQLKITDMFNNRKKNKEQNDGASNEKNIADFSSYEFDKSSDNNQSNRIKISQIFIPRKKNETKQDNQFASKNKSDRLMQVPIYEIKNTQKPSFVSQRMKELQEQKRLKKLQKKQEEKRKSQQLTRKKNQAFTKFLGIFTQKATQRSNIEANKKVQGQLNNISAFNKMQQQDIEKKMVSNAKSNIGLAYKKFTVQRQKIPISFLKLLLSYKFTKQMPNKQQKRVPNSFQDQVTYKKVFHYLVVNQCIADLHLRLQKIEENGVQGFPINLLNFKNNSDGFIQFSISQDIKQNKQNNIIDRDKLPVIKNISLSRNRLGLITNAKSFKLDHFGIPSPKNERIFAFICALVTPQSKQDLSLDTKAFCNIQTENLDIIFKLNKTNRCYFYDLEKISTHLRQYLAITYLEYTDVASFIYNPSLIENRHLDIIPEIEREQLQPILQKLKSEFNSTQYESIRQMVLRESGIVLLQGPPGTGKTTTLMGLLAAQYQYLNNVCTSEQRKKIMVCAPSNAAIDHITKRLYREGLTTTCPNQSINFSRDGMTEENNTSTSTQKVFPKILRVGIVETDDPDIIAVSLDDKCDKQMMKAKQTHIKRNNMTSTQIKQKMYAISKQIHKLRARNDLQEWQKDQKIQNLKYQSKKYDNLLFYFRKQRIELKQTYNQIEKKQFDEADIILTTLSSSGADKMERLRGSIGCLIIDQAAQSTEPNILIPLQTGARKVLLIGDPCQLPSTTMSQDSSITLFNRSLFERFLDNGVRPYFLNIQYRMAPLIREFPSATFYNNRLIDAESIHNRYKQVLQNQQTQQLPLSQNELKPISQFFQRSSIFIDVKFGQEQFHSNSYRNVGECIVLKALILNFIKKTNLSIGVITPYQSQKRYLMKELKKQIADAKELAQELEKYNKNHQQKHNQFRKDEQNNSGIEAEEGQIDQNSIYNQDNQVNQTENKIQQQAQNKNENAQSRRTSKSKKQKKQAQVDKQQNLQQLIQKRVMINTVDSFQGQQKDIIIVSTVRANNRKDIGFMKDERRINVAITRSRHLLIVVGNADTIGSNQIWNKYIEWYEKHNCIYQIKQRQSTKSIIYKIYKGFNQQKIERIRHTKLTRDVRKEERQQIKREDFKMGSGGSKRVKREKNQMESIKKRENIQERITKQPNEKQKTIIQTQMKDQKDKQKNNDDVKRNQQMMEVKRAKQQQAINLQQIQRRIKQLEERMKSEQDNPYANLFG